MSTVNEDGFRKLGNERSINSLAWAGFALTNFATVVSVFSVLGRNTDVAFQIASGLFLMSGGFFVTGWALQEVSGSYYKLELPDKCKGVRLVWLRRNEGDKLTCNPRETYIQQAEKCQQR